MELESTAIGGNGCQDGNGKVNNEEAKVWVAMLKGFTCQIGKPNRCNVENYNV